MPIGLWGLHVGRAVSGCHMNATAEHVGVPGRPEAAARQLSVGIEVLRILACIGIVCFHDEAPGAVLGYAGLPAFMMVSVALATQMRTGRTTGQVFATRFRRMGYPWLFWSLVYGAALLARAQLEHRPLHAAFYPWMLLAGPRLHLWYLPFGLVVTAGVSICAIRRYLPRHRWAVLGWAFASLGLIVVCSQVLHALGQIRPLAQWVFIAPAITLGLGLATLDRVSRILGTGILGAAAACGAGLSLALGWRELAVPYAVGGITTAAAWCFRFPAPVWVTSLSALTLGVYLLHPLVGTVLHRLMLTTPASWTEVWIVTAISGFAVWGLRRTPLRHVV